MTTTNVSVRMDVEIKEQAEELFADLGLNMSTAFNIFVRQSLREGGIPFAVSKRTPNAQTRDAMEEAERLSKDATASTYSDARSAIKSVLSED